jgi:hypothetical protein
MQSNYLIPRGEIFKVVYVQFNKKPVFWATTLAERRYDLSRLKIRGGPEPQGATCIFQEPVTQNQIIHTVHI